jgi:hypothetical protein
MQLCVYYSVGPYHINGVRTCHGYMEKESNLETHQTTTSKNKDITVIVIACS